MEEGQKEEWGKRGKRRGSEGVRERARGSNLAALHEVDESARRSHDQIRSHLNSPEQDPRGGGGRRRSKEES
eukprot:1435586-Rhodomonas_salina.3